MVSSRILNYGAQFEKGKSIGEPDGTRIIGKRLPNGDSGNDETRTIYFTPAVKTLSPDSITMDPFFVFVSALSWRKVRDAIGPASGSGEKLCAIFRPAA